MNDTVCVWIYDEYHDFWGTACGNSWLFDSSLEGGRVKYCPGCGKPVSVAEEKEYPTAMKIETAVDALLRIRAAHWCMVACRCWVCELCRILKLNAFAEWSDTAEGARQYPVPEFQQQPVSVAEDEPHTEASRIEFKSNTAKQCCQWDHNPEFDRWETDCEELCVLWDHADPKEYGFKYCPFCGLEIKWGD